MAIIYVQSLGYLRENKSFTEYCVKIKTENRDLTRITQQWTKLN